MIDKALGFDQPARRRRNDNTSQASSTNEAVTKPTPRSPARNSVRGLSSLSREEPATKAEESNSSAKDQQSSFKSKTRVQPKGSIEQIHSPAVKNLSMARTAKTHQQAMRSSTHLYSSEFAKESSIKLKQETNQSSDMGYKIKLAIFFLVSIFLIFNAMTPARRAPYKKK